MRHTKAGVIARARKEFDRLDRLVNLLQPGDWRRRVPRPEARDPWTVKDTLAHIVYWKEHSARVVRGERRPPELRGLEVNQINAIIFDRWRSRRPPDVVAYHRRTQEDVMRSLRLASEDWFATREHSAYWPGDFDGHSAEHRVRDIEAAIRR